MQAKSRQQPQLYKVDWIGKDNNFLFSKPFTDAQAAIDFAKGNKFSIVSKQVKASKEAFQYEIIPTVSARELVKNIKLRKSIDKKNMFYNADGISQTEVASTSQVKASQNVRLISMFAFTPVLIYAGTRQELPTWLKYSLFGVAALNFVFNAKNYNTNKKIEQSLEQEEE